MSCHTTGDLPCVLLYAFKCAGRGMVDFLSAVQARLKTGCCFADVMYRTGKAAGLFRTEG